MPIAPADAEATRRFAGYPVAAALSLQGLDIQSGSTGLDAVLAALSDSQVTMLQGVFLTPLALLESDLTNARDSLDTAKAAVWTRNPAEMAEREALFLATRRRMCAWLGIPPGPGLFVGGAATSGSEPGIVPAALVV